VLNDSIEHKEFDGIEKSLYVINDLILLFKLFCAYSDSLIKELIHKTK